MVWQALKRSKPSNQLAILRSDAAPAPKEYATYFTYNNRTDAIKRILDFLKME